MVSLKYSGPVSIVIGITIVAVFTFFNPPANNIISAWLVWDALTVSQVLPFVGLGIALSLISRPLFIISIIFFLLAYIFALINYNKIWIYFANPADISQHLYLTLPIASFCSGLLLVSPDFLRKYLVLPVCLITGAMLAITVKLTDPTLHDPIIPQLGFIIALWIIISIMMSVKAYYKTWFSIAIRILGSWLLASSLLYGGTALAIKYGLIAPKDNPSKNIKKESVKDEELFIPDFN